MPLRVLVIDRSPPSTDRQGNSLIGLQLFRRLHEQHGHEFTLLSPSADPDSAAQEHVLGSAFAQVRLVPRAGWTPALGGWLEGKIAESVPALPFLDMAAARRMRAAVHQAARDRAYDVVHVRQLPMAPYGEALDGGARLLELIDSETLGSERARPRTLPRVVRARAAALAERDALHRFDAITTVADADASRLRRLAPAARIVVVPNGVDADRFKPVSGAREHPGRVIFVGAMSYPPNVAAVSFFADHVMPRIRAQEPAAVLQVVGRDPSSAVRALGKRPDVEVTGEVDDVRPYISAAPVVVIPMVSGSGIKNKLLEALAMGRAVVTTRLGMEGMPIQDGLHALVADEPEAFAEAVLQLMRDPDERRRLGTAARQLVERVYTWERCAATYHELYAELVELAANQRR